MSDEAALIPLHVMLGQGLRVFNSLEAACKRLDASYAVFIGSKGDDDKVREAILKSVSKIEKLDAELAEVWNAVASHSHGMELIENTPDSQDAIQRALQPSPAGEYTPLPLEEEYRAHWEEFTAAEIKRKKLVQAMEDEVKCVAEHRSLTPGPFEQKLLRQMFVMKLKREAHFGGCFVGDDIHALMDPEIIHIICAILGEPVVGTQFKVGSVLRWARSR